MDRPNPPTYQFGWKYGCRPNFGSDHLAVLKLYVQDLEEYIDGLEGPTTEEVH